MEPIKLQKYFSDCGVMSRRAAEEKIKNRLVTVNGRVAELGQRIQPDLDRVEYNGKRVVPQATEHIYVMLNKPRGYVTSLSDEKGRKTVCELIKDIDARIYPVGRLDMDSDGLLLLTNDGELANRLTHPRHEIPKIYHVTVSSEVNEATLLSLSSPMVLDGYKILPVETLILSTSNAPSPSTTLQMTLYEGRNRQIRKMCKKNDLTVTRLCRVALGNISLGSLPKGKWRYLTPDEVEYLKGNANK